MKNKPFVELRLWVILWAMGAALRCASGIDGDDASSSHRGTVIDPCETNVNDMGGNDTGSPNDVQQPNDTQNANDTNGTVDPNSNQNTRAPGNYTGPADTDSTGDGDSTTPAGGKADPTVMQLSKGVSAGTWQSMSLPAKNSNYYTGIDPGKHPPINNLVRTIEVFTPAGFQKNVEAPLMIVHDGSDFKYLLQNSLPNLIASGALPPLVAVTISPGSLFGSKNERSWELDVVSSKWSDFVENEVLPAVESKFGLKLTKDPALRCVHGGSSGGSGSVIMAWLHPERYGRVLTFSASLVNNYPTPPDYPDGAWAFPANLFPNQPKKNLRIVLQASQWDLGNGTNGKSDWLHANQIAAKALKAKGYHYKFVYVPNGGHEEASALKQNMAIYLAWVWKGWKTKT